MQILWLFMKTLWVLQARLVSSVELLVVDPAGSCDLPSLSSVRLHKVSLIFDCGSLYFFLSVTGWRSSHDNWDSHQYYHRSWPVQDIHPLFLGVLAVVIPVDLWEFPLPQISTWTWEAPPSPPHLQSSLSVLSPLPTSKLILSPPMSQSTKEISIAPFQGNPWMPPGHSLLPSLSESKDCSMVFFYFRVYIHLWVNTYHVCLSGSRLLHSERFFSTSIHMP